MSGLTARLVGKRVEGVFANGSQLLIRCDDGSEVIVAWVDNNGRPIKGSPAIAQVGARLIARGLQDLVRVPHH